MLELSIYFSSMGQNFDENFKMKEKGDSFETKNEAGVREASKTLPRPFLQELG